MRTRLGTVVRCVGTLGAVVALGPGFSACGGEVMVGEAEVMSTEALAEQCADNSAQLRDPRARWLATPNDFGELAGSRWEGSMKALPTLVLELRADQTGTLAVGTIEPPPTDVNDGYLVMAEPYPIGGTFPLHGGSFDGTELLLPLPPNAPFDAWCALQPPVDGNSYDPCDFSTSNGTSCSLEGICELNSGRVVTEAWVDTGYDGGCTCTPTECFADVFWPIEWQVGDTFADIEDYVDMPVLRLVYDPEADTLEGGHFPEGSAPPDGVRAQFVRVE